MCSRPQFTDLAYIGGTGPCGLMTIISGSAIWRSYTSLIIKFGVNGAFHVLKPQFTGLAYMGGTEPCGPIMIILGSVI